VEYLEWQIRFRGVKRESTLMKQAKERPPMQQQEQEKFSHPVKQGLVAIILGIYCNTIRYALQQALNDSCFTGQ